MLSAPEKCHALPVVRYINYLLTYYAAKKKIGDNLRVLPAYKNCVHKVHDVALETLLDKQSSTNVC